LEPNVSFIPLNSSFDFENLLYEFKNKNPKIKKIANAGCTAIKKISNEDIVFKNLNLLLSSI
jgi:hypothetical protein